MKAEKWIALSDFRFHPCISRASPTDLFEQPAIRVFQQPVVTQLWNETSQR
jgi:hypothetical protein